MRGARRIEGSSDHKEKLSVRTYSRPYAPYHDRYQKYYREGFDASLKRNGPNNLNSIIAEHYLAWSLLNSLEFLFNH